MAVTINGDGLIEVGGTSTTQGRVRLAEDTDNGTNYIELTAPASVASNRTMTFPDATTTVVGTDTTQTLTNKTINASQLVAASVTSTQLATAVQPIGVGQTFQTPSRAFNTTYTNSTGRPIAVYIRIVTLSGTGATLFVDGVAIAQDSGVTNIGSNLSCIVPAGSTYIVSTTGTPSLNSWAELR
jgi:hypothetical protein